jgi:hypothetical protein
MNPVLRCAVLSCLVMAQALVAAPAGAASKKASPPPASKVSAAAAPAPAAASASESRPNVLSITQGAVVLDAPYPLRGSAELLFDGHPKTGTNTYGKPYPLTDRKSVV